MVETSAVVSEAVEHDAMESKAVEPNDMEIDAEKSNVLLSTPPTSSPFSCERRATSGHTCQHVASRLIHRLGGR